MRTYTVNPVTVYWNTEQNCNCVKNNCWYNKQVNEKMEVRSPIPVNFCLSDSYVRVP